MLLFITALLLTLNPHEPVGQSRSRGPDAASGASMFTQLYRHWNVPCDQGDFRDIRVVFDVEIDRTGRFVRPPVLVRPVDSPEYRLVAASAMKALLDAEPFDVPARFEGGHFRPTFLPGRVCTSS